MFKDFWDKQKHQIQLVSILVAIGALFLSITPPESEKARSALFNIQLAWLIIITIALVILFVNFIALMSRAEGEASVKYKIPLELTISLLALFISVWILINLWIYIINLYREPLLKFFQASYFFISFSIFSTIIYWIAKIIFSKIRKVSISVILYLLMTSILLGFWSDLFDLKFSFKSWAQNSAIVLVICVIYFSYKIIYKKIKSGRNINSEKKSY